MSLLQQDTADWTDGRDIFNGVKSYYASIDKVWWQSTLKMMIKFRGWEPSRSLIEKNAKRVFGDLHCVYAPNSTPWGPNYIFPLVDLKGKAVKCQVRGPKKEDRYCLKGLTDKSEFVGPTWFGNSKRVIEHVIECGWVLLVEGPFDLIATRLLNPNIPVLSTLSINFGAGHLAYLQMLGVNTIHCMYDNDTAKRGVYGVGEKGYFEVRRKCEGLINVNRQYCPAHDPSDVLCSPTAARIMKEMLESLEEQI
jgi:hypothetical protein